MEEQCIDENETFSPSPASSASPLPSPSSSSSNTICHFKFDDICIVETAPFAFVGCQIYSMTSRPRGFCLIINNVDFADDNYPRRSGSDEESRRLSGVFSQLYFQVIYRRNLSYNEMIAHFHAIASHRDLERHDAFVMIILSHGSSGAIFASDNRPLPFEDLLNMFNNQNCPSLIAKPKMFFFNCCRGSAQDFGPNFNANRGRVMSSSVPINSINISDVVDAAPFAKVPIVSDMMICFSTIDGYVSWRNEQHGTWFGSALSSALAQHACRCELNQILTIAADLVQKKMTRNGAKQAIEWKYRAWTKSLYFNPGI